MTFFLVGLSVMAFSGCSSLDRMSAKMDMASMHMGEPGKPVFEGEVEASKRVGSMVSVQFKNGELYDVSEASPVFYQGDIVRIYKTKKGYEARLWKAMQNANEIIAPPPQALNY